MLSVLASGGLAPWGQAAAIILALYMFISIIIGLALAAALMFGFAWIREKSELLRQIRPHVSELNQAAIAVRRGDPLPQEVAENKVISVVAQVPKMAENIAARSSDVEQKVDLGSERVAHAVIEFYARTAMVKGMARAFFLPGLTRTRPAPPLAHPVTLPQEQEREEEQVEVAASGPREEPPLEQEIVITQYTH